MGLLFHSVKGFRGSDLCIGVRCASGILLSQVQRATFRHENSIPQALTRMHTTTIRILEQGREFEYRNILAIRALSDTFSPLVLSLSFFLGW